MQPSPSSLEQITGLSALASRSADAHKGTFGRVLVVAGSRGMSGAAVLCGSAALRGGAGLVRLAVPEEVVPLVAPANPCLMTAGLPQDELGHLGPQAEGQLLALASAHDVLAVGPGLGRGKALPGLLLAVLGGVQRPLVLDADGLTALQQHADRFHDRNPPAVLTPHPGEFARMIGTDTQTVQARRQELAVRFAAAHGVVLALKGNATLVTDGRRLYRNTTGNPGMATAGSGDVLTGLIAALLGQGLAPFEAAQLGVHLHGLAGDLARDDVGEVSLVATDLLNYLPRAFRARSG